MRSGRGPPGAGRHLFRVFPRIIDVPAYVISRGRTGFAIGARGRRGPAAPPGAAPAQQAELAHAETQLHRTTTGQACTHHTHRVTPGLGWPRLGRPAP